MKNKKAKHARLESKRFVFFQIGLIVAASMVLAAFEWIDVDTYSLKNKNETFEKESFNVPEFIEDEPKEEIKEEVQTKVEKQNDNTPENTENQTEIQPIVEVIEGKGEETKFDLTLVNIQYNGGGAPEKKEVEYDSWALTDSAKFPGGMRELYKFLKKNTTYPRFEKELGLEQKVFVGFLVNKDGTIGKIEVLNESTVSKGFSQESKKVISKMPKWKPGEINGKKVSVRYVIPIDFKLKKDDL